MTARARAARLIERLGYGRALAHAVRCERDARGDTRAYWTGVRECVEALILSAPSLNSEQLS